VISWFQSLLSHSTCTATAGGAFFWAIAAPISEAASSSAAAAVVYKGNKLTATSGYGQELASYPSRLVAAAPADAQSLRSGVAASGPIMLTLLDSYGHTVGLCCAS
jgi:hypothetical protein